MEATGQGGEVVWIRSNQNDGQWHVGVRHEARGERTGKLYSVSYRTRCSGRQLGGAWGYETTRTLPGSVCSRCAALAAKEAS